MLAEAPSWYVPPTQRPEITSEQHNTLAVNAAMDQIAGRHFPQNLRQGIKSVATENNISPWDVVRMIRESDNPEQAAEIRKKYQEKTIYFGCIHGGSPEFVTQLNTLANSADIDLPETIVFGGDLSGAIEQRTIRQKQLFYDYLMNRASPLLSANPDLPLNELLEASGSRPPADSPTIHDGVVKLLRFALSEMGGHDLSNKSEDIEIKRLIHQQMRPGESLPSDEELQQLDTDEQLDGYIRWIRANNLNSGTWVGTLPKNIRQAYMDQYQQAAESLAEPLLRLKERNVEIIWVEGNEDNCLSLDAISHGLDRVFDTQEYFEGLGIPCERQISGKDGKATYHILVPFSPLRDIETVPLEKILGVLSDVRKAREQGKAVVMVAHAQLDWTRHYPGQKASGYNAKVGETLQTLLEMYQPDELIYPHQHAEMPAVPDINAKYVEGQTVVTYLPLLKKGELTLPIQDRRGRTITLFGGKRHPVRRIK